MRRASSVLNGGNTKLIVALAVAWLDITTSLKRGYSVFPPHYIQPIPRKEDQEALFQSDEAKKIVHEQVKPALVMDTCSEFYDKRVLIFINTLMKNGNRKLATTLV
ncbi:small ribosomal subunit protein uS7m-like [Temnothorax americanus]|uniref:small ribosomal subunit protein uS7m-like n=1 Tax=Temnothorax americanus TaxID=1964332 RepID=UPI0040699156